MDLTNLIKLLGKTLSVKLLLLIVLGSLMFIAYSISDITITQEITQNQTTDQRQWQNQNTIIINPYVYQNIRIRTDVIRPTKTCVWFLCRSYLSNIDPSDYKDKPLGWWNAFQIGKTIYVQYIVIDEGDPN